MALTLSTALADYDRVQPLFAGTVASDRLTLHAVPLAPSEIFFRLLGAAEFDVAEMSLSSYLIARETGWEYTAIPVFPNRRLFHLGLWTTAEGPDAATLAGSRIGLTEYQVTAAVWTRGTLADDFGLDLRDVVWYVERPKELSHGGETGFRPPDGIEIRTLEPGDTLEAALARGELDVILPSPYPGMASRLNRTDEQDLESSDRFRPLFPDARAEAARYVAAHDGLPMNHAVVIRTALLAEHPWLPGEVFRQFQEAKSVAQQSRASLRRSHLVLSTTYLQEERTLFGDDPYPYGLAANAGPLRTLARYSVEQGLTSREAEIDTLFADVADD